MATKIEIQIFQNLLRDSLAGQELQLTGGDNPFHAIVSGKEYWLYIKKITSAHFRNPDVSRAQFPSRDIFTQIKESGVDFVLLGYDKENNVFATWNPLWVMQRINDCENISEYSRFSLQKASHDENKFVHKVLSNDSEVVIFPCDKLGEYLPDMQSWFQAQGDYVAVGSKRRTEANDAFRTFKAASNLNAFAPFLASKGFHPQEVASYCRIIRKLIKDGYFSRSRKLFYQYDSLSDYSLAFERFVSVEEVAAKDEEWGHLIMPSLNAYIDFLIRPSADTTTAEANLPLDFGPDSLQPSDDPEQVHTYAIPDEESPFLQDGRSSVPYGSHSNNWEAEFTDANGKWTKIANPEVIDLIRPYLAGEYQQPLVAFNLIQDYYGDRLPQMSLVEWYKLMNDINWEDPYVHEKEGAGFVDENTDAIEHEVHTRTRRFTLRVEFPDGHIIQEKVVGDTYIAAIKEIEPDLVELVELSHAGVGVVSKTLNERYAKYQKPIGDGWYVMTNSSTQTKYNDLVKISEALELGLKVTLVPIGDNEGEIEPEEVE